MGCETADNCFFVCVCVCVQGYLKEFNELHEELQGKKVGIFAVCAQPQASVDKAMKEWGLKFTVSN